MLTKRIIPCLDVMEGRVVKGTIFSSSKTPAIRGEREAYEEQLADELCFLDITASHEKRRTIIDVVERVPTRSSCRDGGRRHTLLDDIRGHLKGRGGQSDVNTTAVENPEFVRESSEIFGSQCICVAIDAKRREGGGFEVYTYGGRRPTGIDASAGRRRWRSWGGGDTPYQHGPGRDEDWLRYRSDEAIAES